MYELIVDCDYPEPELLLALHGAITAIFGDKLISMSAKNNHITGQKSLKLVFEPPLSPEDEKVAREIILKHDFTTKTPAQLAQEQRRERLLTARQNAAAISLDTLAGRPESEILAAVLQKLTWLELEVQTLREQVRE